eukprot:14157057-Alexandrium_andersonii.AAC.1
MPPSVKWSLLRTRGRAPADLVGRLDRILGEGVQVRPRVTVALVALALGVGRAERRLRTELVAGGDQLGVGCLGE